MVFTGFGDFVPGRRLRAVIPDRKIDNFRVFLPYFDRFGHFDTFRPDWIGVCARNTRNCGQKHRLFTAFSSFP